MLLGLLLPLAAAGTAEQAACCARSGLEACGGELRVYGDDTRLSRDPGGWMLEGLWTLSCDGGATFDRESVVYLDHAPQPGEIAMPEVSPAEVACFLEACALPRDLCASAPDAAGIRTLRGCATGRPPDRTAMLLPPAAPSTARVVIGGKLIYADPVATPSTPAAPPAPAPAAQPPALSVAVDNLYVADPISALVAGLPPDPTSVCQAQSDAARVESRQLVLYADDLRLAGDNAGALARFRAALTVDRCNAYGWLGLGQAAAALSRPDLAIRALRNATLLMPRHYGAWTELGKAYEAIGQLAMANDSFGRALALNATYAEALAGARRVAERQSRP